MTQLNQVIAVEKGIKARVTSTVTDIHKTCQKPALFSGFDKKYHPNVEDGDIFPAEGALVQVDAEDLINRAMESWVELFDVTATKDTGNTQARADVVVGDKVLVENAPVTYLLFLEKQLNDVRTFIAKLPTLDPSLDWKKGEGDARFKTDVRQTIKTKKVARSLVLHEGNEHHAPQVQMVPEDVIIGLWDQVNFSGAIPETKQRALLAKVEKLQKAVKEAREEANSIEVEKVKVGSQVMTWLFAGGN